MIPAEAVEAAARAMTSLAGYDWDAMDAPDDVVADYKEQALGQARLILEAAAPHMQAQGWDEAYRAGIDDILRGEPKEPRPNPYRPTP